MIKETVSKYLGNMLQSSHFSKQIQQSVQVGLTAATLSVFNKIGNSNQKFMINLPEQENKPNSVQKMSKPPLPTINERKSWVNKSRIGRIKIDYPKERTSSKGNLNYNRNRKFSLEKAVNHENKIQFPKNQSNSEKERIINYLYKKKEYSRIVKKNFWPNIDPMKKKEIDFIKARLETPSPIKHFPHLSEKSTAPTQRKIPKVKSTANISKEKHIKIFDFLAEKRKNRESVERMYLKSIERGVSQNDINSDLDKKVRRVEGIVKHMNLNDPRAISAEENMNDIIISSVRSKISKLL